MAPSRVGLDYILSTHRECHFSHAHNRLVVEPYPWADITPLGSWLRIFSISWIITFLLAIN